MNKILIIDSCLQSLELLSQRLSYYDYNVITTDSGVAGLTKARLFLPDLVIVNTELIDMSGYNVCKKLKETEQTKLILVLFISNLETKDANFRAFEVGGDDFIEKNADSMILLSKVKSLLRVKHLVRQLGSKYAELQEKNKILDFQLKMARQVQRSLIQNYDFISNDVHFYSNYLPVLDIGGDFYDIVDLGENRVGVMIGDVSGHGISAALLTSMLNMLFTNLSFKYFEPDKLLFYMNNQFCNVFKNSTNEMYACVFYAIFDTKRHKIYYSNAGQTLPIFIDFDKSEALELQAYGVPIGILPDSTYELKEIIYNENDLLFFYTDGLSDTFYKDNNDEFVSKIKELLIDLNKTETPEEIAKILLNVFHKFNATESEKLSLDDISLILCKASAKS